jgi:hypothetical protein
MMITNGILGGVADTVAQSITAIRQRALRKPGGLRSSDPVAIEIHELDKSNPISSRELIPDSKMLPPPFDFERLARFVGYGFGIASIQFKWFQFLQRAFPITKTGSAIGPALKRVAFDQLIFAPFGMLKFLFPLIRKLLTPFARNRSVLYRDDDCRRWWKTCRCSKAPRHLYSNIESELHHLASSTNIELPCYTNSVPIGEIYS